MFNDAQKTWWVVGIVAACFLPGNKSPWSLQETMTFLNSGYRPQAACFPLILGWYFSMPTKRCSQVRVEWPPAILSKAICKSREFLVHKPSHSGSNRAHSQAIYAESTTATSASKTLMKFMIMSFMSAHFPVDGKKEKMASQSYSFGWDAQFSHCAVSK